MKIHVLSDLHIEWDEFKLPETDSDVLVLAGDIGEGLTGINLALEWAKDRPVIYSIGNHEYYRQSWPSHKQVMKNAATSSNLHVLDNDSVVISGVRFLGATLWTDFSLYGIGSEFNSRLIAGHNMRDYDLIRRDGGGLLLPIDTQRENDKSVTWIRNQISEKFNGPTVVVTHHAPSAKMANPFFRDNDPLNPAYMSHLDYLMGPNIDLWISGHTHYSTHVEVNGTQLVSNCRGYTGEEETIGDFDPCLVIEV